ncbi:unnamed protein product, partial [Rotaria socialis]
SPSLFSGTTSINRSVCYTISWNHIHFCFLRRVQFRHHHRYAE